MQPLSDEYYIKQMEDRQKMAKQFVLSKYDEKKGGSFPINYDIGQHNSWLAHDPMCHMCFSDDEFKTKNTIYCKTCEQVKCTSTTLTTGKTTNIKIIEYDNVLNLLNSILTEEWYHVILVNTQDFHNIKPTRDRFQKVITFDKVSFVNIFRCTHGWFTSNTDVNIDEHEKTQELLRFLNAKAKDYKNITIYHLKNECHKKTANVLMHHILLTRGNIKSALETYTFKSPEASNIPM